MSVTLTVILKITASDFDVAQTIIDQIKTKVEQAEWVCEQSYECKEQIAV